MTATRPRPRIAPFAVAAVLAVLAAVGPAAARGDLGRSAYGPVAQDLVAAAFGVVVACEVVLDADTVCFASAPATVAGVAEAIEALVARSAGRLERGAWTSANGVHRVDLTLVDGAWGTLEVWLREAGDREVRGMLRFVPHHRVKGP